MVFLMVVGFEFGVCGLVECVFVCGGFDIVCCVCC